MFTTLLNPKSSSLRIGPSNVQGLGVFTEKAFSKGEIVCFFHGRKMSYKDYASTPAYIRKRMCQYMMSMSENRLCVPTRADGSIPMFPPSHAGCLVNEASNKLKPNVMTQIPFNKGESIGCPFLGEDVAVYDWPMIALTDIPIGTELLTCYGSQYGPRNYNVSKLCKKCF